MRSVSEFAARMQLSPAELAASARPILETLGDELITRIPPSAALRIGTDPLRDHYQAGFKERLDGALRDIEIGFIGGRNMAVSMKDADRRAMILQRFYDERHNSRDGWVKIPLDPTASQEEQKIIYNICGQLHQNALIEWKGNSRGTSDGLGKITARGIDVLEGNATSPLAITIDKRTYSISNAAGVVFGDHNVQGDIRLDANIVFDAIDRSPGTDAEKEKAKALWQRVLENPILWSIVGGIAGSE